MALDMVERESHGVVVLELSGRLVLGQETMDFRSKISEVLSNGEWYKQKWGWEARILLDLSQVAFLDSAGMGALIRAHASAINQGTSIKLANLTKKIREQLQITKVVTVFDVYDSVDAAVNSFLKTEPRADATPA
jgi:anti-sigma B factor antagonist